MRAKIQGEGDLVVLLHGYGGAPRDWRFLLESKNFHFTSVNVNLCSLLAGPEPISFHDQADILETFLRQTVGEKRFHLIGMSYGGALSLVMRERFGDQVMSHAMINPMPFDPIRHMRHRMLKLMVWARRRSYLSADVFRFRLGRLALDQVSKTFQLTNRWRAPKYLMRKIGYLQKSFDRFIWIADHEDWSQWASTSAAEDLIPTSMIYSMNDPLFSEEAFLHLVEGIEFCRIQQLTDPEHLVHNTASAELATFINGHLEHHQSDAGQAANL